MNKKSMTAQEITQRVDFLKEHILNILTLENECYEEKLIGAFFSIAGTEEIDQDTVVTFQSLWFVLKDAAELRDLNAKLKAYESDTPA